LHGVDRKEQHTILFVTSGGFQAEFAILVYLKEGAANGPAVRDHMYLQNYYTYYRSYYYYYYYYYYCYYHYYYKKGHEEVE
jgi:hypothetical protein